MATTLPGSTHGNIAVLARHLTGAPVAADSATIADATFAPADGVVCTGWKTVAIFCRLTAAGATTANIQALIRAGATPTTAESWIVADPAAGGGAAADGQFVVFTVMGRLLFPRVHALTGNPTVVDVYVAGWEPMPRETARA